MKFKSGKSEDGIGILKHTPILTAKTHKKLKI
jgi:hypothetical protein